MLNRIFSWKLIAVFGIAATLSVIVVLFRYDYRIKPDENVVGAGAFHIRFDRLTGKAEYIRPTPATK